MITLRLRVCKPHRRAFGVTRIDLETDSFGAQRLGGDKRGSRAKERVENARVSRAVKPDAA